MWQNWGNKSRQAGSRNHTLNCYARAASRVPLLFDKGTWVSAGGSRNLLSWLLELPGSCSTASSMSERERAFNNWGMVTWLLVVEDKAKMILLPTLMIKKLFLFTSKKYSKLWTLSLSRLYSFPEKVEASEAGFSFLLYKPHDLEQLTFLSSRSQFPHL